MTNFLFLPSFYFFVLFGRAYLRLGELMVEKNNYREATKYLRRANELEVSSHFPSLLFSPISLITTLVTPPLSFLELIILQPSSSTEALLRETQAYAVPDQIVVTSYPACTYLPLRHSLPLFISPDTKHIYRR